MKGPQLRGIRTQATQPDIITIHRMPAIVDLTFSPPRGVRASPWAWGKRLQLVHRQIREAMLESGFDEAQLCSPHFDHSTVNALCSRLPGHGFAITVLTGISELIDALNVTSSCLWLLTDHPPSRLLIMRSSQCQQKQKTTTPTSLFVQSSHVAGWPATGSFPARRVRSGVRSLYIHTDSGLSVTLHCLCGQGKTSSPLAQKFARIYEHNKHLRLATCRCGRCCCVLYVFSVLRPHLLCTQAVLLLCEGGGGPSCPNPPGKTSTFTFTGNAQRSAT